MATKVERPKHLRDLFTKGKLVTIKIPTPDDPMEFWEFEIWLQKPSITEQEQAAAKARAKAARLKSEFRNQESDEYLVLMGDVEDDDRDTLKRRIIDAEASKLKTQAFNEVMYDEDFQLKDEEGKPRFGKDATGYADLLAAIANRMEEIDQINLDMPEEDRKERWVMFDEDEELIRLRADKDQVEDAITERFDVLYNNRVRDLEGVPTAELRQRLAAVYRETQVNVEWFQVFNSEMLWRSCRFPDNHKKYYFESPAEVLDLPRDVVDYLLNETEALSMTGVELKN